MGGDDVVMPKEIEFDPPQPVDPPGIFTIELFKNGPLGMGLDLSDGTNAMVSQLKAGVVSDWNAGHPSRSIDYGDLITEVNGVSGTSKALVEEIKASRSMNMLIKRAQLRTVVVSREKNLGAEFISSKSAKALCLKTLNQGALTDWNRKNPRDPVAEGDRLFEVNGMQDPEAMNQILQSDVKYLD